MAQGNIIYDQADSLVGKKIPVPVKNGATKMRYRSIMFNIGGFRFMPFIRSINRDMGSDNYYYLFTALPNNKRISGYYRSGGDNIDKVKGVGLTVTYLSNSRIYSRVRFDYWRQEKTQFNNFNIDSYTLYRLSDKVGILGSVGYKTMGDLIGKQFQQGLYGSAGCVFYL
jgi:hypothetical protein